MAQHDYVIDNQAGLAFRQDLNNVLKAIAENNMGATAPTTTYAGMWWLDISTNPASLRMRNSSNSAWLSFGDISKLSFLSGVTSDIQTQLNAKLSIADFTKSIGGSNGWQKLPSGLIIQWGYTGTVSQDTDVAITYPIAFPVSTLAPVVTYQGTGDVWAKLNSNSKTGLSARAEFAGVGVGGSGNIMWIAIGY